MKRIPSPRAAEQLAEAPQSHKSPRSYRRCEPDGNLVVRGVVRRNAFYKNSPSPPCALERSDVSSIYPNSPAEKRLRDWQESFVTAATLDETSHSSIQDFVEVPLSEDRKPKSLPAAPFDDDSCSDISEASTLDGSALDESPSVASSITEISQLNASLTARDLGCLASLALSEKSEDRAAQAALDVRTDHGSEVDTVRDELRW
jgi:hypothetical protein